MKKLAVIISSLCAMLSYAQNVSDYKYVVVPNAFESFKKDNYGLSAFLTKSLQTKKYAVITENRGQWPEEANRNPCSVLNADIINDSGFLKNKVIVEFKDCNSKIISSQKGSSSIKEFEEGFKDAVSKALVTVPSSSPVEMSGLKSENKASLESAPHVSQVSASAEQAKNADHYSNGKLDFQKVRISATQFILVDGNSSDPFATFTETTKKDVYRVKLSNGESTIGYLENGNLIIEIPKGKDDFYKEIFEPSK